MIAERLDDVQLTSYALDARALTAFVAGDHAEAQRWWTRRTALADRISDLDHLEDLYGAAIAGYVGLGQFDEARRYAQLHDDIAMQLSSHQKVHAVAMHLELEELAGNWPSIMRLRQRTEEAVAANAATPCVRNERSLLVCALAAAETDDPAEPDRLAGEADALGMEGYDAVFYPVRVRLAIRRGDLAAVRRFLPAEMPPPTKNWWRLTTIAARLDALVALGEFDLAADEAQRALARGGLLEPIALRTLGLATGNRLQVELAAARFDEQGLGWHAAQTREMLEQVTAAPTMFAGGPRSQP